MMTNNSKLYCARVQSEVFRRCYFLCGAFFKTKDIVILRSSFKKRTTQKRARLKLQIVPARSILAAFSLLYMPHVFSTPQPQFYAAINAGVFQANFSNQYLDQTDLIAQNITESVQQNGYTGGIAFGYIPFIKQRYYFGGEVSGHLNSDTAIYQSGAATAAFSDSIQWRDYIDFSLISGLTTTSSFSPYLKLGLSYAHMRDVLVSPTGYTPTFVDYHANKSVLGFAAALGVTHPVSNKLMLFSEVNVHDYETLHFDGFQNFTADYSHSAHLRAYGLSIGAAYTFNT